MVEIHLGNKEAIKILRRLRSQKDNPPYVRGFCEKLETAIFSEVEQQDNVESICDIDGHIVNGDDIVTGLIKGELVNGMLCRICRLFVPMPKTKKDYICHTFSTGWRIDGIFKKKCIVCGRLFPKEDCECFCHKDKGACGCPDWNRCCENGSFGDDHKCMKQCDDDLDTAIEADDDDYETFAKG